MCCFISGAALGLFHHARAQENPARMDSVLQLLDRNKHDTLQLGMLIIMAESWYTSSNAFPYIARLDTLSAELLQHPSVAVRKRAQHARGAFHYFTGYHAKFTRNVPLALSSFHAAIADFGVGEHHHAVAESYDALGVLYRAVDEPDKAVQAFREELRLAQLIGHDHLQVQALVHLAAAYADLGDTSTAFAMLDKCAKGGSADSSAVLNERARLRTEQGRVQDAIGLLRRSLNMARRSDNPWDRLPVLAPLARNLLLAGASAEAREIAWECAQLAERMGDQGAHCGCVMLTGIAARAAGDLRGSEDLLLKGLRLAERNGDVGAARELGDEGSMLRAAAELKELYRTQGRTAEALAMTDRWAMFKDSVQRMDGREELLLFEFEKQQLRDSLSTAAKARAGELRHAQQITSEKNRRNLLLVIGAGIIAITLLIWGRLRQMRRSRDAIVKTQGELIRSEKQREAEQVRTRIARDVHDQLGSELTKLSLLGSEIKATAAEGSTSVTGLADDIERIAGEAGRSLRDIVWAVDPQHDSMLGLMDRSRQYCDRMLGKSGIAHSVECSVEGRDQAIDPATKRDLYLILCEAVNNAVKYAKANEISVRFTAYGGRVRLQVQDDGAGFNVPQALRVGNGLRNMKERAARLGAELVIASEPGGGTVVRLEAAVKEIHSTDTIPA